MGAVRCSSPAFGESVETVNSDTIGSAEGGDRSLFSQPKAEEDERYRRVSLAL